MALLIAGPAGAGTYTDIDGTRVTGVDPPERWFNNPRIPTTENFPDRDFTYRLFRAATGKDEQVGCAYIHNGRCCLVVANDLPAEFRDAVYRHELAHCHGWPADHPLDPIPRLRDDYVASSVSQTD